MKKFLLFSALLLLILCGCSKIEPTKPEQKDGITQFYKEHEIKLPQNLNNITAVWQEENHIKAIFSTDTPLAVYTWDEKKETFEKTSDLSFPSGVESVDNIYPLRKGCYLLTYQDDRWAYRCAILDGEKITPVFEDIYSKTNADITCATPVENGFLAGTYENIYFYTYDGKLVNQYNIPNLSTPETITVIDDTMYAFAWDKVKAFSFPDGKQLDFSDETLDRFLQEQPMFLCHYQKSTNEIIKLCSSGIYSFSLKDHSQQHLLKKHINFDYGNKITVLAPNNDLFFFFDDYQSCKGYRFEYVKEGYRSDTEELTLYSLYKNAIPDSFLTEFEEKYPQYYVETKSELDSSISSETLNEESIQNILNNTQTLLASKDSPDVILCDHLPVDSYVESGLLTPLNDHLPKKSADWFFNVLHTFRYDKNTYAIPAAFSIPVITGPQGALDASKDLRTFNDYLAAKAVENENLFYHMDFENLWGALYTAYIPECFLKDGSIDKTMLETFFQCAHTIFETAHPKDANVDLSSENGWIYSFYIPNQYELAADLDELLIHDSPMTMGLLSSIETLPYIKGLKEKNGLASSLLSCGKDSYFVPSTILALPKNASHAEGAKKFLDFVLKKGYDYWTNFPVSFQKLQDTLFAYGEMDAAGRSTIGEGEITKQKPYVQLTKEETMNLFKKFVTCKYSGHSDALTSFLIRQAFDDYQTNRLSLTDAVMSVVTKLNATNTD